MIGLAAPVPGSEPGNTLGLVDTPRILMTLDAVGGVWRYGMDLAKALTPQGYSFIFAGFGPRPTPHQQAEAKSLGALHWFDAPLDWTTEDEKALDVIPALLHTLVEESGANLVQLNLPSQGAGLEVDVPVLVVSHSCVVTWFAAVRKAPVPRDWAWQQERNRAGFDVAAAVVAPSNTHASMLRQSYGAIPSLHVIYNGSDPLPVVARKEPIVFAAGRWWDEGKNGAVLDLAAARAKWPVVMAGSQKGPNGQWMLLSHAQLPGELSHAQVMDRMSRAGIVVSPSLYEPFGLAPLEAANGGAALVLADNPTYRELWEGAALFAAPQDPVGFADAINRLADDETLRWELGDKARERAKRYSVAAQTSAMRDVYDNLLAPNPVAQSA